MGAAVSDWRLARSVSKLGQLGVVSGTAIGVILARRLQLGDPDGHVRRALGHFPSAETVTRVLDAYFVSGGKDPATPFKGLAMPSLTSGDALLDLTVAGSFVEVFLAKEGHSGIVGINLLEKIQLPTLPTLYGAMLAGVDYVLMGAGIPRMIPGALDQMAAGTPATLPLNVEGASDATRFVSTFDPQRFQPKNGRVLNRPHFIGIVASATLAMTLARKSNGRVDGFVVEGESAGGHNAPPRGPLQLGPTGEPVYGPRDVPDLEKIRALGLPFWLAGSYGRPGKLPEAIQLGASGIQVGTAFAFCEESGVHPDLKRRVLALSRAGAARVFTDPFASPTGFPLKVAQLDETLSDAAMFAARPRVCDLGYLRQLYCADNAAGYRCPAEPVDEYIRKGGLLADTEGRKCVCNGLLATAGIGQVRPGLGVESPLMTAGNDIENVATFLKPGANSYTAAEVVECLLSGART
jgi:nitronate monooxygenase